MALVYDEVGGKPVSLKSGADSSSSSSSSSSSRTYRLTLHKLNMIASRTRYRNYGRKVKLMGRIW